MKFIFDVYNKDVKGIIEVNASGDQDAIEKVTKLGLKGVIETDMRVDYLSS